MKESRFHLSAPPEATDGSPPGGRRIPRRSRPIRPSDCPPSPSLPSYSYVPFSWEQRPGIPKTSGTPKSRPSDPLLPLPPSLRSSSSSSSDSFRKKRSDARTCAAADPFAAALAECAKESRPAEMDEFPRRSEKATVRQRKAAVWSISNRFGIFGLVGSCKGGRCSVADSTVYVPRSSLRTGGAYELLNGRAA